jgi:transposase
LTDVIGSLRTYYYHRQHLVEQSAMYVKKMQKALRLMNMRLNVVIRDVAGKSGLNILRPQRYRPHSYRLVQFSHDNF